MRETQRLSTPRYSVKAVSDQLGIGRHTLRAWEVRYGAVVPQRSSTGRRVYSRKEIQRLGRLLKLVNQGYGIGSIASLSDQELDSFIEKSPKPGATDCDLMEDVSPLIETFDLSRVAAFFDAKRGLFGTRQFILEVLAPIVRWVGKKVDNGSFSVAHEHAISAIVKDQIYQTLRQTGASQVSHRGPRVILATPEDDLHELGILMASALFAYYQMPVHFLGANIPAAALAMAVCGIGGDIVVLGNSLISERERQIPLETFLTDLHKHLPSHVEVWMGGGGRVPHLRRGLPRRTCRVLSTLEELDVLISAWE